MALVLAPNVQLCRQVVAAVDSLRGPDNAPLLRAAHLASGSPPPRGRVDIAVATPGEASRVFSLGFASCASLLQCCG